MKNRTWDDCGNILVEVKSKNSDPLIMVINENDWKYLKMIGVKSIRNNNGYAWCSVKGKPHAVHRLLLPFSTCVDHANHDKMDNRRENIRSCTYAENLRNRSISKSNRTGATGVYSKYKARVGRIYTARISVNGKSINLGTFDSFDEARNARQEAERKYFREYAISDKPYKFRRWHTGMPVALVQS
jgi:hypothetical protein|tara:strand:- start:603 stop:1160 length:558 start_codon:yes stop_codon:yes gene_type:complete